MRINIDVKEICIVTGSGSDKILMETSMPEAAFPFEKSGQMITLEAAKGTGLSYVQTMWPNVPIRVVHMRDGE